MDQPLIPAELYNPALLLADPRQGYAPPLYVVLGVLFGLLIVGSIVAAVLGPRLVRRHRLRLRLLRQLCGWVGAISAAGLFWVVCRAIGMPLFARPLWLWFTLIALGIVAGYAVYYWRKRYPRENSAYEEAVRRRRWMPQPRKRAAVRRR
jgi:amino acid transporter